MLPPRYGVTVTYPVLGTTSYGPPPSAWQQHQRRRKSEWWRWWRRSSFDAIAAASAVVASGPARVSAVAASAATAAAAPLLVHDAEQAQFVVQFGPVADQIEAAVEHVVRQQRDDHAGPWTAESAPQPTPTPSPPAAATAVALDDDRQCTKYERVHVWLYHILTKDSRRGEIDSVP